MKQKVLASTLSIFSFVTSFMCASAHAVIFEPPPNSGAPRQAKGGASRRKITFVPHPERQTPSQTSGGASRGSLFTPKLGNGAPKSSVGGASRGDSLDSTAKNINLQSNAVPTAMILPVLPQTFFGTTVSENPNILVYLPESTAKEAIFSLKNADGKVLNRITLPVSGKAEVISVQVPTALEIGRDYQWFLALKIDGRLSPRTPYVDGWIQRIQPNAELQAIQQKDGLERTTAFCKNGVWYDCVVTLAKLRNEQPNNKTLDRHWSELLASVQLKNIDNAPVVALKTDIQ